MRSCFHPLNMAFHSSGGWLELAARSAGRLSGAGRTRRRSTRQPAARHGRRAGSRWRRFQLPAGCLRGCDMVRPCCILLDTSAPASTEGSCKRHKLVSGHSRSCVMDANHAGQAKRLPPCQLNIASSSRLAGCTRRAGGDCCCRPRPAAPTWQHLRRGGGCGGPMARRPSWQTGSRGCTP
jgi:hypothetical protein